MNEPEFKSLIDCINADHIRVGGANWMLLLTLSKRRSSAKKNGALERLPLCVVAARLTCDHNALVKRALLVRS